MSVLRGILLIVLLAPVGLMSASAQNRGLLEVSGRVSINSKPVKLIRKRFYLFRGGLVANKAIVDKLKATEPATRDCFYCKLNASSEYIAWLRTGDCESPYCREITTDDIAKVREFQDAYQKGLKRYPGKPLLAQKWLTTYLAPDLRDGFYRQRKALIANILGGVKPLKTAMTDSITIAATFIDIPLASTDPSTKSKETFLISNLIPIEIGGKSYLWACEKDIGSSAKETLRLAVPEAGKTIKGCEVIIRDIPVCTTGSCQK